jgi:hypothetical protein
MPIFTQSPQATGFISLGRKSQDSPNQEESPQGTRPRMSTPKPVHLAGS